MLSFISFRTIWLLSFLVTAAFFVYMMTDRTVYYFTYSKSTRIRVKEARPLAFPAVTICNLNLYRKSAMANETFIEQLLKDSFSGQKPTINLSDPEVIAQGAKIKMAEFAARAAHKLEEMFKECRWLSAQILCQEYFTPTITQMGQCYTFNSIKYIANTSKTLATHGTGSSRGLYVRLNVEHNEYTYGLSSSAGFKVTFICTYTCKVSIYPFETCNLEPVFKYIGLNLFTA